MAITFGFFFLLVKACLGKGVMVETNDNSNVIYKVLRKSQDAAYLRRYQSFNFSLTHRHMLGHYVVENHGSVNINTSFH